MQPPVSPCRWASGVWVAAVFVLLETVSWMEPAWIRAAFCKPAGYLAAWFFNTSASLGPDGVLVLHHALMDLRITPACSGFSFYMLLLLTLGWLMLTRLRVSRALCLLLLLVPAAYALTLLTNMVRLILSVYGRAVCDRFLVPDMADAMHLASGVVIFLPVLILTFLLLERSCHHVCRSV